MTRQQALKEAWALNLVVESVTFQASLQSPMAWEGLPVHVLFLFLFAVPNRILMFYSEVLFVNIAKQFLLLMTHLEIYCEYTYYSTYSILNILMHEVTALFSTRQDEDESPASLASAAGAIFEQQ